MFYITGLYLARYQAERVAEIGGDAAVAFAEGCNFSIRESETRDWAVVWRAASFVGAKRDLGGAKTNCGRLFFFKAPGGSAGEPSPRHGTFHGTVRLVRPSANADF